MTRDSGICTHEIVYNLCVATMNGIRRDELERCHPNTYDLGYYVSFAVQLELIQESNILRTTPRGRVFVEAYEHINSFLQTNRSKQKFKQ